MKFKYWALSLLACGGMLSCTNEDVVDSTTGKGETSTSYLAVNILNSGAPGTRADYDDGEGAESTINNVRFYLFNADGSAYNGFTSGSGFVNYYDVTPNPNFNTQGSTDDNIEKVSDAVLVIKGAKGEIPASMVAVINGKYEPNPMTLDNLKGMIGNSWGEGTAFVMSNSAYSGGCETKLTAADFKTSEDAAKLAPVDVYVERVLAKVRPTISMQSSGTTSTEPSVNLYKVHTADASIPGDEDVYIKINGWALADANGKSYLCKKLGTYSNLGITLDGDHRSFWATSVAFGEGNNKVNQSWSAITTQLGATLYTQENTPVDAFGAADDVLNGNDLTKLIVSATLCDKSGTPITRITHRGVDYSSDEAGLLSQIAQYQKPTGKDGYYVKDGTSYRLINNEDVELKTATELLSNPSTSSGIDSYSDAYRVYVQLKDVTELYKDDQGTPADITTDQFNANLRTQENSVMYWKSGQTYYYVPISHLGNDKTKLGTYGIVRNHAYQVNITDIMGFGTPVYKNDETIIPVTPSDDASYLAAKINVLSWRIVSSDVTLGGE